MCSAETLVFTKSDDDIVLSSPLLLFTDWIVNTELRMVLPVLSTEPIVTNENTVARMSARRQDGSRAISGLLSEISHKVGQTHKKK